MFAPRPSPPPATVFEQVFERARRHPVTTHIPPAHSKIAATLGWETATMQEVWELSDRAGIPAGAILRALDKLEGADPERRCEVGEH